VVTNPTTASNVQGTADTMRNHTGVWPKSRMQARVAARTAPAHIAHSSIRRVPDGFTTTEMAIDIRKGERCSKRLSSDD